MAFRTDRMNNPTAMTTDVALTLGMRPGIDFVSGDTFQTSDGKTLATAKIIGDPFDKTIQGLDNAAQSGRGAFLTSSGAPRWSHISMSDQDWLSKNLEEKRQTIKKMYQSEGGSGSLNLLSQFAEKVEKSRNVGKTDTEILNYLANQNSEIASKISQSRSLYSKVGSKVTNDRDLINYLTQRYSGRFPAIESVSLEEGAKIKRDTEKGYTGPKTSIGKLALGTAQGINELYRKFTKLKPVAAFAKGVGAAVGATGTILGAGIGATGETVVQTVRGIEGKGFDWAKIAQSSVEIAKQTGKFGTEIGAEAAPMAFLGGTGRIINLALAYGAGYSGYDEFRHGLDEKDYVKMYSGLQSMIVGGLGAKEGIFAKEKGLLFDKPTVDQIKSEFDFIRSGGKPEVLAEKAKAKSANIIRAVLNPAKGELKNIEIRKKKSLDYYTSKIAEEGLIIGKDVNNKLDTLQARDINLEKIDGFDGILQEKLRNKPKKSVDLNEVRRQARVEINKKEITELEKNDWKKDVDDFINAELRAKNPKVRNLESKSVKSKVNLSEANSQKRGYWKMGYNQTRPSANKVARLLGHIMSEKIEKAFPDKEIKSLNSQMGDLMTINSLLENAHGRPIRGSFKGNLIARITGGVAGHTLPIPIIGPIVGEVVGGKIHEVVTSPERLTQYAGKIAKKQRPPSLLKKLYPKENNLIE